MPDRRFFADLPSGHRSDWGEAFATALRAELDEMNPVGVSTSARVWRGGTLELLIKGSGGEQIEISCGEDEAIVRHGGQTQRFQNRAGVHRWRPDPGHDWIPEAVDFVVRIVREWAPSPESL
jgi:hypothetical protein